MDFSLPEELEMLRDMVRDFATEKIAPFADEWDEKHYFPYEEVRWGSWAFLVRSFPKPTAARKWVGWLP
jgi:glutaryl-CoA dehydrogenase (non-decarboxylating)